LRTGAGVLVQGSAGFVMGAGFAKTMTSLLTLPSVLSVAFIFIFMLS